MDIYHSTDRQRFEYQQDGQTAYLSYQVDGNTLVYDHTIVPTSLGGQGIGTALVKHALNYAKNNDKKVIPACSFVATFIQKHPAYQKLLAPL